MWTKANVLATRKEVEGMNEKQLHAHLEEWSNRARGLPLGAPAAVLSPIYHFYTTFIPLWRL